MTRLTLDCRECNGDGRLWCQTDVDYWRMIGECDACDGSGIERCSECSEPAVEIYRSRSPSTGETFHHPVCAAHLAEWREDEAERGEELDPDRLRDDAIERAALRKEWAA